MKDRVILHYDMDAFYASVEIRDNPQLKNRPLVVGGGVVTTASYPARKYGVHSAMSVAEARILCPNLIVVPCDKNKYMSVSKYIHSLVEKVTNKVEYIALDEGFLDVTEVIEKYPSKKYFAEKFKERIYKKTGLTCSVGIGYNKLTAKIASDINKPYGFYIFNNSDEFINYIKEKEIKIIPGVGKKFRALLEKKKITKVKDVYKYSIQELISMFSTSRGSLLYFYSRGLDDSPVARDRKHLSIGNETTYREPLKTDEEIIRGYTLMFEKSYKRLIENKFVCKNIGIKVRYKDFTTISRSKNLHEKTDNKIELFSVVEELFDGIENRKDIRLLGVSFSNITKKNKFRVQLTFSFK